VGTPHEFGRAAARCRHFGECGGCDRQDVVYAEQLRHKRLHVEELLRAALGARAPRVEAMIGMAAGADGMPWHFRQKAAFVFGADPDGRLVMGHFARGTHRVVPIVECPVHAARANRIAFALRDELARDGLRAAGEPGGLLRHVLVRTTADEREAAAVLVVTRDDPALRAPLQRLLDSPERPTGLMLNLHDRPGPYLVGRETLRIDGPGHVREQGLGASFLVSPTGFFQTNVRAAAELARLVEAGLPRRPRLRVLELYAGSGLFALPIALRGHTVTAVEESRKATRDAALNGRSNRVPEERLHLVCARVEDALPRLSRRRYDAVILDPPRQGCPPQVLRTVAQRIAPERLILVSCNPEALARELAAALDAGYAAERIRPVDMFPHTAHIEVVAVLERRRRVTAFVRQGAHGPASPAARAAPSRRPGTGGGPARTGGGGGG
jgi:23S rRNA (uracil1939-C5)-methyltransferase